MAHCPLRILCISPVFPPTADSEAFCGGKMVLALKEAGADVVVLRTRPPFDARIDSSSCWAPLADWTHEIEMSDTWNKPWAFLLGGRYGSLRKGRLVHDHVRQALQWHRAKPFHLVYSRSLPMYAHIIGHWCSRALGVPWIANVNDPWDLHLFPEADRKPPSWTYGAMSKYWLRKTLASASLMTYPSARLRDFHIRLSGLRHGSAIITHIGWTRTTDPRPRGGLHLVHAGKLVDRISKRGSSALLRGFHQFLSHCPQARSEVRMTLVGPEDADSKELLAGLGLQDRVAWTGQVSYEESLLHIQQASVCVLVEGSMNEGIYLPSKVADYAAAGKAILALSPAAGVIADLRPCRGLVRVDPQDVPAVSQAMGQFYHLHKQGRLQSEQLTDEFMSQFLPVHVADKFLRAVSAVISGRSSTPESNESPATIPASQR